MLDPNPHAELAHDQASKYWENDELELAVKARIKLLVEEADPQKAYKLIQGGESFDAVSDVVFAALGASHIWEEDLVEAVKHLIITLRREVGEEIEGDLT